MNKIAILGYGQIGQAIAKFYKKPMIRDLNKNEFKQGIDVLHVCIPGNKNFSKIVEQNIKEYNPKLVIINSTVPAGTTRELFKRFKNVVHSPVRGVHPNLYEGIKTFVKYIGTDSYNLGVKVADHFKKIGIKPCIIDKSISTELGKLLDTTYYGTCIAFHEYAAKLCGTVKVDFEEVMREFNTTYNQGYIKLGKPEVVRPVLYAPKGKIGGHCVIPNAEILQKQFGKNELLTSILKLK